MFGEYENFEKCCGGRITPESITRFQRAMVEYAIFHDHMSQLVAPGGIVIEIIKCTAGDHDEQR